MNTYKRYVLVHTKKGSILAKETIDENIVIGLYNDKPYHLKKGDLLEEVDARFAAETLKSLNDENKDRENNWLQWIFYITTLVVGLAALYPSFYPSTIRLTLFQILAPVLTLITMTLYIIILKKKMKKVFEKNYYTALKDSQRL